MQAGLGKSFWSTAMTDRVYPAILHGVECWTSHRTTEDAREEYQLETADGLVAVGTGDTPIDAINDAVAKMESLLRKNGVVPQ